jgi:hypothetical protein
VPIFIPSIIFVKLILTLPTAILMRFALLIFQLMFCVFIYIAVLIAITLYSEVMAALFAVQTILVFLVYYIVNTENKPL